MSFLNCLKISVGVVAIFGSMTVGLLAAITGGVYGKLHRVLVGVLLIVGTMATAIYFFDQVAR